MIWGWLCALAAAGCYGVASVGQAVGVRALSRAPRGATLQHRAWAGRWYAVGLALDGIGFVAAVVALQALPLFVVQAAVAASVGVTALVARIALGVELGRVQVIALAGLATGLVVLSASAPTQSVQPVSSQIEWILVAFAVPLAVVAAAVWWRAARSECAAVALAVCAGLSFAGVGIASRVVVVATPWWSTVATPPIWAIAAYGLVSTLVFASALARGSVTVVTAVSLSVETVVPTVVGLVVLGDRIRPGFEVPVGCGLLIVIISCMGLAGRAHPEVAEEAINIG